MKNHFMGWGLGLGMAVAMVTATELPAKDFGEGADPTGYDLTSNLVRSCIANAKKDCEAWAAQGGGSEAPRGLRKDTKVELAIGEKYILSGSVDFMENVPYLRVDFSEQPWLANRTRVRNPFYRIKDSAANWVRYRGKRVTVIVTARYGIYRAGGRTMYEIFLEPASESVINALQNPNRH